MAVSLSALLTSLSGCSFDAEASSAADVAEHTDALVSDNGLTMNRLAANKLATNRLAVNRLAANRIALNKLATNRLAVNRLAANRIALNKLATNRLAANALTANRIAANGLTGNRGTLSGSVKGQGLLGEFADPRRTSSEFNVAGFSAQRERKQIESPRSQADYAAFTNLVTNQVASFYAAKEPAVFERAVFEPAVFVGASSDSEVEDEGATELIEIEAQSVGTLLTTEDGREVMKYMVSCALRENQSLMGAHDGNVYEFVGSLGLAQNWTQDPLSEADQRWVSACLFARVNAHGISVEVSLRGAHPQLSVSADEMATWKLEEGAFWGNLFAPGDEIDWNACEGLDQLEGEQGALDDRDCTEPDPENPGFTVCGLKSAGACAALGERASCSHFDATGTYYSQCGSEGAPKVNEVITTFVRATH